MSVFRPVARPTAKNKVLNPPSSHQTLWTSSRKKETSAPSTTTATSTATSTVTEPTPKEEGIVDFVTYMFMALYMPKCRAESQYFTINRE